MSKIKYISVLFSMVFLFCAFISSYNAFPDRITILPSTQRTGDPEKGYDYLINGNYVSSGIPFDIYKSMMPQDSKNLLNRQDESSQVAPEFNLVTHTNGTRIATPNCLTCHADRINGNYIVGLGNNSFNYTFNVQSFTGFLSGVITNKFGNDSKQYEAFSNFRTASKALGEHLITSVQGVNPADKLTSVLVAHRDPVTLEWQEEPQLVIPAQMIPTDVPAWWLLKKKNAMFYTGIGRGDFSRFLMASSILTLKDSTEAAQIDSHFPDVLAWINQLEPPKYPGVIDTNLASIGEKLFNLNCSECHGRYGNNPEYPNLLISLEEIGTDDALSKAYTSGLYSEFISWYEKSWFTTGNHPGKITVQPGYVAPPLDGVWATAPYLHNGSVPNVALLLNSTQRPKYWKRSFNSNDYDMNALGWKYLKQDRKSDNQTYDTTLDAYGNTGHTFGDDLDDQERIAVIEYLKTL